MSDNLWRLRKYDYTIARGRLDSADSRRPYRNGPAPARWAFRECAEILRMEHRRNGETGLFFSLVQCAATIYLNRNNGLWRKA